MISHKLNFSKDVHAVPCAVPAARASSALAAGGTATLPFIASFFVFAFGLRFCMGHAFTGGSFASSAALILASSAATCPLHAPAPRSSPKPPHRHPPAPRRPRAA